MDGNRPGDRRDPRRGARCNHRSRTLMAPPPSGAVGTDVHRLHRRYDPRRACRRNDGLPSRLSDYRVRRLPADGGGATLPYAKSLTMSGSSAVYMALIAGFVSGLFGADWIGSMLVRLGKFIRRRGYRLPM